MKRAVGIDLGTTNSAIAIVGEDGQPRVLTYNNERLIPSVVAIDDNGKLLVGSEARNYLPVDPNNAVRSVKRAMGSEQIFTMREQEYSPQQISALILRKLRALAEAALGEPIERAVITVPAYFTDQQRIATKEAGELAGLEVVRIINEPTASALAYGVQHDIGQRVLVYDLGGGTFDVSLVQIDDSMVEVLATAGNNRLGGDDFDRRLADYISDRFHRTNNYDLRSDIRAHVRLAMAAEKAKISLSDYPFTQLREPFIITVNGTPYHIDEEIAQARFTQLIADLLDDTLKCVDQVLRDANCRPRQIDKVLLVGGSTRIPAIRDLLEEHLGQTPSNEINPDECVALGAAVQAAIIDGVNVDAILVDVTAHSLGVSTLGFYGGSFIDDRFSTIIPRNTVIPTEKAKVYQTVADNQKSVAIEVYQGEQQIASENDLLGKFMLEGLPLRPAGEVEVVVTFSLDINGILHVTAKERRTGKSADITVRDMRSRTNSNKTDMEAILALWDADVNNDSRQALLERARNIAGQKSKSKADEINALVAEIEAFLAEAAPDADTLDDLEEALLELLDE